LRPTTGKRGAIHRVTFFRLMKHDLISEAHRRTLYRERHKLQRTLCRPNLAGSMHARYAFWFVCLHIKPHLSRRSRRKGGNLEHQTSPRLRPSSFCLLNFAPSAFSSWRPSLVASRH
jgi:hypothetical protein